MGKARNYREYLGIYKYVLTWSREATIKKKRNLKERNEIYKQFNNLKNID
jgi:hypothetical protein